jgi:hypothetical protein
MTQATSPNIINSKYEKRNENSIQFSEFFKNAENIIKKVFLDLTKNNKKNIKIVEENTLFLKEL